MRGNPPVARITISPDSGDTDTNFRFDASESEASDGNIVKYEWKFAGGTRYDQRIFERKFPENGTYSVTLTVTDSGGMEDTATEEVEVGDGPPTGERRVCTTPAKNNDLIFGTVVAVEGFYAIVRLPAGSTCENSFYRCGDMRRADPERFRGIITKMEDRGNGTFAVYNDCPFEWPPDIGEEVFLYYKTCAENHCP